MKKKVTSTKKKSEYEGLQEGIRKLKLPPIDVWTNKYMDKEYEVKIFTSEFTSVCPKTNLPDHGTIAIKYVPKKKCIELRSFKEYLLAYRNLGIFYEHAANKILEDVVESCKPKRAKIEAEFKPRGGLATVVKASYDEKKGYIFGNMKD